MYYPLVINMINSSTRLVGCDAFMDATRKAGWDASKEDTIWEIGS
jgi:hypothetical protein